MNQPTLLLFGILVLVGLKGGSTFRYELKKEGKTCLILDTEAKVSVAYLNTEGKQVVATWSLQQASSVGGQCDFESADGQASSLNLTFPGHWLELQFANKSGEVSLAAMSLSVDVRNGSQFVNPNATGLRVLTAKLNMTLSPDTQYFACASALQLDFTEAPAGSSLSLTGTKLQAFGVQNGNFSDQFVICSQDGTSSVAPTTTTAAPVTTTAAPTTTTPSALPPLLNLTLNDPATNTPCLRLQLRATFAILYALKTGGNATTTVALPADAQVNGGDCGNTNQTMWIGFFQGAWAAEVSFAKQDAGGYALRYLQLHYQLSPERFPNASDPPGQNRSSVGNQTYFSVGANSGDYYMCSAKLRFTLDALVTMETQDLRAQAFRTNNGSALFFGSAVECSDDTPIDNVVPIVVGSALAGLVLIVLVAYLIGRRRHSSGGGYQSV